MTLEIEIAFCGVLVRGLRLHRALLRCVLHYRQRLDLGLDPLHFRSYSMRFYYSFLAYRFSPISTTLNLWPWVASTLPFSMGRPLTLRGRKPTSSSSSSSTGEFRNLLYPSYIKLDFVSSVTSSFGVKGEVSAVVRLDALAVLDLSMASDERVVKARG